MVLIQVFFIVSLSLVLIDARPIIFPNINAIKVETMGESSGVLLSERMENLTKEFVRQRSQMIYSEKDDSSERSDFVLNSKHDQFSEDMALLKSHTKYAEAVEQQLTDEGRLQAEPNSQLREMEEKLISLTNENDRLRWDLNYTEVAEQQLSADLVRVKSELSSQQRLMETEIMSLASGNKKLRKQIYLSQVVEQQLRTDMERIKSETSMQLRQQNEKIMSLTNQNVELSKMLQQYINHETAHYNESLITGNNGGLMDIRWDPTYCSNNATLFYNDYVDGTLSQPEMDSTDDVKLRYVHRNPRWLNDESDNEEYSNLYELKYNITELSLPPTNNLAIFATV